MGLFTTAFLGCYLYALYVLWHPSSTSDALDGHQSRRIGAVRWGILLQVMGTVIDLAFVSLEYKGPPAFPVTSLAMGIVFVWAIAREHMALGRYKIRRDRDFSIARTIQRGLLPEGPPSLDGFDIAGWSQAADEAGGDVYDFQMLSHGQCMILLADVSSHGIGPALLAAEVRAYFRALSMQTTDVSRVMRDLQRLLSDDLDGGWGVTCFLGRLDAGKRELSYVSAGQAPLLFYDGKTRRFSERGATTIPLYGGLLDASVDTDPHRHAFAPGDMLIVPSDGLWEVDDGRGGLLGTDGFCRILGTGSPGTAADVVDRAWMGVADFAGKRKQVDDQTLLVVRRLME